MLFFSAFFTAGAGDQGIMFGYATDETEECMPLTAILSHKLNSRIAELRRSGQFEWARPDSKAQVTCEYKFEQGAAIPLRVHTVVVSVQHSEKISLENLREEIREHVIKPVIPGKRWSLNSWSEIAPDQKWKIRYA